VRIDVVDQTVQSGLLCQTLKTNDRFQAILRCEDSLRESGNSYLGRRQAEMAACGCFSWQFSARESSKRRKAEKNAAKQEKALSGVAFAFAVSWISAAVTKAETRISPTVATDSPALFYLRAKSAEKSWQGNKTVGK